MMLGEMTHWSDWVVVGIFGLFMLAAIDHLIQVFTGPQRLRAFILALITPVIGAIIAVLVGALLHPGEEQQEAAPPAAATRTLPTPEWARELVPALERWIDTVDIDVSCVALDWKSGQRFIHCISGSHATDLGKSSAITYGFELRDGVLYPHNGLALGLLQEQQRKGHRLPRFGTVRIADDFLRAPGPDMTTLEAEIRRPMNVKQ